VGVIPNVMRFVVKPGGSPYTNPLPATLRPFTPIPEGEAVQNRTLELYKVPDDCTGQRWSINGLRFDDITEFPVRGTTEIWQWVNRSGFMHPMHMHLVEFHVLDRQPFVLVDGVVTPTGPRVAPDSVGAFWKDTTPVLPFEIVRVICRFQDYTGLYPYHCHIIDHEDHEMMRQMKVMGGPGETGVGTPGKVHGVQLGPSFPNPTSGVANIAFSLPARANVRLEVEDVAGRRVATLLNQSLDAGPHQVMWAGHGANGEMVAPGVYFYRLMVDGEATAARRLVVLR